MNGQKFSNDLTGLVNSYAQQGVAINDLVGALELAKLDLVRNVQDAIRAQQQRIIKASQLPPNGNAR